MSVVINFKICDNAQECSGIEACPNGAIYWDEEKETLATNNSICTGCGICEDVCPIGAIRTAKTDEEYALLEKEIEEDERTTEDLFVDRYGAVPIDDAKNIRYDELVQKLQTEQGVIIAEFYDDNSIQCLLKSIPVSDIIKMIKECVAYYKVEVSDTVIDEFSITELPTLCIFKSGHLKKKIDGYYEIEDAEKLNSIIGEI